LPGERITGAQKGLLDTNSIICSISSAVLPSIRIVRSISSAHFSRFGFLAFGSIIFISSEEQDTVKRDFFSTTGLEPFADEFNGQYLQRLAKGRQQAVKIFIMTGRTVAGIGNIYANESLFAAGIRPSRKINRISRKKWNRLVVEIRKVLKQAISCGGSTISDFVNVSQERGYFQMNFKVYGRSGENCPICSAVIKKQTIGGRASYYCPKCQK